MLCFLWQTVSFRKKAYNKGNIDKLKDHIMVKLKVLILGGILTELNILNKDKRSQIIEIMLLWNGVRYTGILDIKLL